MRRGLGLLAIIAMLLTACAGARPTNLGHRGGALAPCPESPNCVSSAATDELHRIAALEADWQAARDALAAMPRTVIVTEEAGYVHAECTTPLMGYVDDLELLRLPGGMIAVRSASRVGHGDMGANRDRVEALRATLAGSAPTD